MARYGNLEVRMRVLIADDDPIIRLDLRQMLETLGYQVVAEAEDGQQAVALAGEQSPEVCLFDVKMPAVDGIDAARQVAEEGLAPVVLLTAYNDPEFIERAKGAGVFGYLVKPFKPSDLRPAIEVARSRFEQNQLLAKQIADVTERLEARKFIEQAKGILMREPGVDESEAYRRIQLRSMNERRSMREIAEEIIASS